jgi:hypothetical protein
MRPHGRWQGDSGGIRSGKGWPSWVVCTFKYLNVIKHSNGPSMSSLKMTHLLYSRPQKSPPNTDIKGISRSILVDGVERVLSYDGTGQYNRDGTGASACGLAALNFARIVFSMEQGGLQNIALLQAVLARECAEVRRLYSSPYSSTSSSPKETTAISALWSGNLHLDVEDICRVPLFEKTLKLATTTYGLSGVSEFKSLLT